jgi:integrase
MRFMLHGKAREMGLGRWAEDPDKGVTLKEARIRARAAKSKLDAGTDPLAQREAEERERRAAELDREATAVAVGDDRSFEAAFDEWMAAHGPAMRTERQRKLARGLMKNHVFPKLRGKPVTTISTGDMFEVLSPIWRTIPETAFRVRIRCEAVFAWARAAGWRQASNPAIWKDNLAPLLGRQGEVARVKHHRAMHWRDVPAFMKRLEADGSMSALALRWTILNAARTNESLGAAQEEVDDRAPGGPVWVIPGSRMKMGVEHRVPLSQAAIEVRQRAKAMGQGSLYLFPGHAGSRGGAIAGGREGAEVGGLSNMALLALLRRLKVEGQTTVHGFRSSFRDWVADCTSTPEAIAEAALAHTVGTESQRAYNRSDLLEKRRALMEAWATYCLASPTSVADLAAEKAKRLASA